jgi:hypothetical protein
VVLFVCLAGALATPTGRGVGAARIGIEPQATVPVDGVIEAAYGDPIAADPAADIDEPNLDLQELYLTDDATNFFIALKGGTVGNYGMEFHLSLFADSVTPSSAPNNSYSRNFAFDDGLRSFQAPYEIRDQRREQRQRQYR